MSEHIDDTTETEAGSRHGRKRTPGSYYYDDATGYELYDPGADDDDAEEEPHAPHENRDDRT